MASKSIYKGNTIFKPTNLNLLLIIFKERFTPRQGRYLKLKIKRIKTRYWRPGTDVISEITTILHDELKDGDLISVSEKALATALGLVVDESLVSSSSLSRFIASFWMRRIWGGPLGVLTRLKPQTLFNLRNYPTDFGAKHKQLALMRVGFLQALRHYSEGGIDASNLPYMFVSLPLSNAINIAEQIERALYEGTGRKVSVMIVDGDSTYSWKNLHIAPRQVNIPGLIHFGGFIAFVVGRVFRFRSRPTPVALVGNQFNPDRALWLAKTAHKISGAGAGRTVWGMSRRFKTDLAGITYEMLESLEHVPILIFRIEEDP